MEDGGYSGIDIKALLGSVRIKSVLRRALTLIISCAATSALGTVLGSIGILSSLFTIIFVLMAALFVVLNFYSGRVRFIRLGSYIDYYCELVPGFLIYAVLTYLFFIIFRDFEWVQTAVGSTLVLKLINTEMNIFLIQPIFFIIVFVVLLLSPVGLERVMDDIEYQKGICSDDTAEEGEKNICLMTS